MRKYKNIFGIVLFIFCLNSFGQESLSVERNYSLNSGISGIYYNGLHGKVQSSKVIDFSYRYSRLGRQKSIIGLDISNTNQPYHSEIEYVSASTNIDLNYQYLWQVKGNDAFSGIDLKSRYMLNFFPKLNEDYMNWNLITSIGYAAEYSIGIKNKPLQVRVDFPLLSMMAESKFKRIVSENNNSKEPTVFSLGTIANITDLNIEMSYPTFKIMNQCFNTNLEFNYSRYPSFQNQNLTIFRLMAGFSTSF